jgi:hypothetical protein
MRQEPIKSYKKHQEDIYVYVEKYSRSESLVLIDFYDSNEFIQFLSVAAVSGALGLPSMILIRNYKGRRVREGSTYRIPRFILQDYLERSQPEAVQDSYVIGYKWDLQSSEQQLFFNDGKFTDEEKWIRNEEMYTCDNLDDLEFSYPGKTEVKVKNVHQGSWNEVLINGSPKIIFDMGTSYYTKRRDVDNWLLGINERYQESKPVCLISHWDLDHYHLLFALADATLCSFSAFICRGVLPNLTSRIIYSKLLNLNPTSLKSLPATPAAPRRNSERLVRLSPVSAKFLIYNGSQHSSRNKSGLCMAVKTHESNLVFGADMDYSQLSAYVLPDLNYRSNHHLIVPHHGGRAGVFVYNPGKSIPQNAIISVGPNPYGHPLEINIRQLTRLTFNVLQTRLSGPEINIRLS